MPSSFFIEQEQQKMLLNGQFSKEGLDEVGKEEPSLKKKADSPVENPQEVQVVQPRTVRTTRKRKTSGNSEEKSNVKTICVDYDFYLFLMSVRMRLLRDEKRSLTFGEILKELLKSEIKKEMGVNDKL